MKFKKILILFLATFLFSGYSKYFISDKDNSSNLYYGRYTLRTIFHGDAFLNDLNSDLKCEGIFMVLQVISKDKVQEYKDTVKPGLPISRLKCSDGRLLRLETKESDKIDGVDQYDRVYKLKAVKRKDYKRYIKENTSK